MQFNKGNAKRYGRKGGEATARKWAAIKAAKAREERRAKETQEFKRFERAEVGIFDGVAMADIFHERIDKARALIVEESDDNGDALGVHVGADGIVCYFFAYPNDVKKVVRFNRSAYLFGAYLF